MVCFGKRFCPFCIEVRSTFKALGVPLVDVLLDEDPDGTQMWEALKKMHAPQKTVPYVYVNKVARKGT